MRRKLAALFLLVGVACFPVEADAASCQATTLASGRAAVCALREDGKVSCWADYETEYGRAPLRRREQGEFRAISVGFDRSCGVRTNGTVACWRGFSVEDGLDLPAPQGSFRTLSIAYDTSCGLLETGMLACWENDSPQVVYTPIGGTFEEFQGACGRRSDGTIDCIRDWTAPEGKFQSLSHTGTFPLCGIRDSGELFCWGKNGAAFPYSEPLPQGSFVQVSGAGEEVFGSGDGGCAIDTEQRLVCWGTTRGNPAIEGSFREVSAGGAFPCAVRTDGEVVCWPDYSAPYVQAWQPITGVFSQVATGGDLLRRPTACALSIDGTASCWGNDDWSALQMPGGTWLQLTMAPYNGCGLRVGGSVECWGDSQLGMQDVPEGVFRQVSAGDGHACGIRDDGTLACWGYREASLYAPEGRYLQVAEGLYHGCALKEDGRVRCWNYWNLPEIEEIPAPEGTFVQISASGQMYSADRHLSCGVRSDGKVECWGNTDEELLATPDGVFVQVAAGALQACALRADGEVTCWGHDLLGGRLLSAPEGPFVQIESGYAETCGVHTDGSVECWGSDQTLSICAPDDLCGNGSIDEGEGCDDGDDVFAFGNGCTALCTLAPCGQPVGATAPAPTVTDALFVLRAGVGTAACAHSVCDVDADSEIDVTDALVVLRGALGLGADFHCGATGTDGDTENP